LDDGTLKTAPDDLAGMIPDRQVSAGSDIAVAVEALTVQLCGSWAELEAHGASWERVLDSSPGATSFVTREWLGAWWTAFAPGSQLVALLFFDSGELVGLAPLYRDVEGPLGMRVNRLRFVGDGSNDSDNLDFAVRPGYERSCVDAFLSWLERQSPAEVCELNTLASDSPTAHWLLRRLKERRWVHEVSTHPRLVIPLPTSFEAYLARLSRDERWRITSHERRLKAKYQVRARRSDDEAHLSADLETLFRLHQKRWVERGGPGTLTSPARRQFYGDVARRFVARNWLEFWLLEADGQPLAAQFCFRYRDTVHTLQEGFDPDYSKDRPGVFLRAQVLRQAISEGALRYDFLAGGDPSKMRWGPETWQYLDIHFARPASRAGLYLDLRRGGRAAKKWLRARLPASVAATTRRTYYALEKHLADRRR
jgi:CelD/BcsL family acetyltransferase involved in cellulose biosynthesis